MAVFTTLVRGSASSGHEICLFEQDYPSNGFDGVLNWNIKSMRPTSMALSNRYSSISGVRDPLNQGLEPGHVYIGSLASHVANATDLLLISDHG